jgi:hypothetical protein
MVRIDPVEHLERPSKKLIARDVAVVVGVSAFKAWPATMTATSSSMAALTSFAALCAHFFARELTIAVGIETRERGFSSGVELCARQHTVAIGVGLKHAVSSAVGRRAILRLCKAASARRQNRSTSGSKQNFTHLGRLLPAAPMAANSLSRSPTGASFR